MSRSPHLEKMAARNRLQHHGDFKYEDAEWMRDAYTARGLSLRQIAEEAQCGLRTVARWMRTHDIPIDRERKPRRRRGAGHSAWKGGPPPCPECGQPKVRAASTCIACRVKAGNANPNWRGDEISYGSAHERVRALRGPAWGHTCAHCGGSAAHWAYDHQDPDARRDAVGKNKGPYSLSPAHYLSLCVPCHVRLDLGDGPPHGSYSRYTNQGCRCDDCRASAREYRRTRRAAG